ncbi:uncharacterized protein LOC121875443 [Homarus americanus]|uniref:Uncharacterized protein n=1 Tax=Homarus americanus TaxID=6706 RepID=A0A8J5JNQ0_HOMAM|nr:uncharacterized protein LOC121875443 [Homarus americanus]KAG7161131.1 hypothetical protein Hamer_G026480 [Homarus americanus]
MWVHLAVLVASLGSVLTSMSPPEAMLKKYAYIKIMSSCVGEEPVRQWGQQMKAACDKCHGIDTYDIIPDFQDMLNELRRNAYRRPMYVPVPVYSPYQFPQYPQMPQFTQYGQVNQYNPYQNVAGMRTKRFAPLSPEKIETLKERMTAKISNITCVLREVKMLDSNNMPNYAYIGQEILNLPVDDSLKADFGEALETCRDFSMCLPVEKAKNPLKKELGTALAFLKCMMMKEVTACMRADFHKYAAEMGLGDQDGVLSDPLLASAGLGMNADGPHSLLEDVEALMFSGGDMVF